MAKMAWPPTTDPEPRPDHRDSRAAVRPARTARRARAGSAGAARDPAWSFLDESASPSLIAAGYRWRSHGPVTPWPRRYRPVLAPRSKAGAGPGRNGAPPSKGPHPVGAGPRALPR